MRNFPLILVALIVAVGPARAQSASQSRSPSESQTQILVTEDDGWCVHLGDDPAYAAPNFDDSTWQQTSFVDDLPSPSLRDTPAGFASASRSPRRAAPSISF